MVEVIESTLVVPSEETPKGKLCLSNLEQVAPIYFACTVYFYRKNEASDHEYFFNIEVMKAALAKTLVHFYPLAGRFLINDDSRRVIDCNAEGAVFVVARSERTADEISFQPSAELRNQFVPKVESYSPMTMLQITYLKCGGVVLGTANNHVLIDGRGAFHFFQTWARIARGEEDTGITPPCFDFTLIRPRSPPKITSDYADYTSDPVKNTTPDLSSCVTTEFRLSAEQIGFLKSGCSEGSTNSRVSGFCAISALLWKSYCIAQELAPDTETRFHFTADIRRRIQPPLPDNFFGNTVIRTSTVTEASKLTSGPIHVAANIVKAAVAQVTDDYIRSFVDYIEVNLDKKLSLVKDLPKSDLRISNIAGMPVYEADFGWGAPELMTWAQALGSNVIYVKNEAEDAGIIAYVSLEHDTMEKFKKAFYDELSLHVSHLI